jgi:hypothetical protein
MMDYVKVAIMKGKTMIKISPLAWAKIVSAQSFRDWECGFWAITELDDACKIVDVYMPVQECNRVRTEFDDDSTNEFISTHLERGYQMRQLSRIWIHTHPGKGVPEPSPHDEETFSAILGCSDFSGMIIFSEDRVKAWIQCTAPGFNDFIRVPQDVICDWTMDIRSKFKVAKWEKLHSERVSELVEEKKETAIETVSRCGFRYEAPDDVCDSCGKVIGNTGYYSCSVCKTLVEWCAECHNARDGICDVCYSVRAQSLGNSDSYAQEVVTCLGFCQACRLVACDLRREPFDQEEYDCMQAETQCERCISRTCKHRTDANFKADIPVPDPVVKKTIEQQVKELNDGKE